ncbi:DMT family transporter [Kitasatospora cystarginea]|uniref:DMT family transporter n=1 Tax=Kitasatospora cystarginea TaxID=58350 RepID=A0ABN3DN74_9ACTN
MRQWWPGFVALSAIWGASFALIKVAVDAGMPPVWVALWRCVLGAAALWTILAVRREAVPREARAWAHSAVVAVLLNAAPFVMFSFGETRISSVLAGVWNATTPLFTLLFALLTASGERLGARRATGLALGFAGIMAVLGVWRGTGSGQPAGSLACLLATACYGAGFAYTRRFLSGLPHSTTSLATLQISCATAELALIAPAAAGAPHWPGAAAALALLALGALGTGVAYILNLNLVRTAGATVAATVTYVTPLWSTALGALLLAEPVHWNTALGGLLVIVAVVLTRTSPRPFRA